MRVKISRWGNSTAVRIPQTLLDRLQLKPGQEVDVSLRDNVVEIRRLDVPATLLELYRLAETQEAPETLDWGHDRGLEILVPDYPDDGTEEISPSISGHYAA